MKNLLLAVMLGTSLVACAQIQGEPRTVSTPGEFDTQAAQVRESIDKMQAQMDRIRQTQDPAERDRLLQEHWVAMQSAMRMLHDMNGPGMGGGPGMRGGMMGWRHMGGYYAGLTPEQLKQRQYMTDQRFQMQQMMMSQMMEHHYWAEQARPPTSGR